ncbi:MAG: hypothetical protein F4Z96_02050 [Chloroflexi bacterium]|nr:hypothetical protein [Chloroflexota bacterium]
MAVYVTEAVSELVTRTDLAELRVDLADLRADFAGLRGDMYQALWIQGAAIVTTMTALVGVGAAIITALS